MKKVAVACLLLGLIVGIPLGIKMDRVHAEGWEWRLWASAAPPKIEYENRHYLRGDRQEPVPGVRVRAHTPGGGEILDLPHRGTQTLVWVRDGDKTWEYELMGGP